MKKETQSTVGPMVGKETERKENRAVGVALVGVAAAVGVAVAAAVAPKVMHEQRTEDRSFFLNKNLINIFNFYA